MQTRLDKDLGASRVARPKRRWIGAGFVLLLALVLLDLRWLDAPLILYPSSGSLPAGFYVRTLRSIAPGEIVAFTAPVTARRDQASDRQDDGAEFLLIKPLTAGPGDQVCNDPLAGLRINDRWIAPTASHDSHGQKLPIWEECRRLTNREAFAVSTFVTNSFDSRYFGPIDLSSIKGGCWLAF